MSLLEDSGHLPPFLFSPPNLVINLYKNKGEGGEAYCIGGWIGCPAISPLLSGGMQQVRELLLGRGEKGGGGGRSGGGGGGEGGGCCGRV